MTLPLVLLNRRRIGGFNPRAILAGSTAFLWLDPSDLTTLFQDAAGTTPVTAPAQPVGLVLDKSQGLVLGPELVTNGDFSSGTTGWTENGTGEWVISGGAASCSAGTGDGKILQACFPTNSWCRVEFDLVYTSGTLQCQNDGIANIVQFATGATSGRKSAIFFSGAGTTLSFRQVNFIGSIDNVSVKLLPGFHATQSTAANRPTYGVVPSRGRVNLLTYTEQFDNAAWLKTAVTVTANAALAPDGTTTADRVVESASGLATRRLNSPNFTLSAASHTYSVYAKADTLSWIRLAEGSTGVFRAAWFNISAGSVGTTAAGLSAVISSVGDGWYRCSITFTAGTATFSGLVVGVSNADNVADYTGTGAGAVLIWGAQLELGSTASPYQRVVSQFEVTDPVGFPSYPLHYLFFGGDLDPRWLQTSTITPNADKVQVFAGVRKLSDAASGCVLELSANINTNAGAVSLFAPSGSPEQYVFGSRGTTARFAIVTSGFAAPITNVLTGLGDISGDLSTLRINGTQAAQNTNDQGTGNYLAYPLFIGRRGGTSLALNGLLFQLIARWSATNLDASLVSQTERFTGQKSGVTI